MLPGLRSAIGFAIAYEPHGEFCPILDGRPVVDLRRNGRVAEIHELQVLEHVEVEVLDVARAVPDRLLANALRPRDPLALRDARVVPPARDVRRADDDHVSAAQVRRRDGVRLAHEGRHLGVDQGKVAGPDEGRVADHVPLGVSHGSLLFSRSVGALSRQRRGRNRGSREAGYPAARSLSKSSRTRPRNFPLDSAAARP